MWNREAARQCPEMADREAEGSAAAGREAVSMALSAEQLIVERGRRVLQLEREALDRAAIELGTDFAAAVSLLAACQGRVIVSGVGKSGLIGRKIAATMTSTGTPAMFLHPVEGLHGDLGIVGPGDIAILISKSGETEELYGLIEALARLGVKIIAMTSVRTSRLARHSQVVLELGVREEACPLDLAPTTSTTVSLALGDAIAVALLQEKGFRAEDFARFHPGGSLGRKLLVRVAEVMEQENLPVLKPDATMREALVLLAERRGIVVIAETAGARADALQAESFGAVHGVITSGDLTRLLEKKDMVALGVPVSEVMTRSPHMAHDDELGSAAVHRMEKFGIIAMPVTTQDGSLVGVVHLHDLMRAGVA